MFFTQFHTEFHRVCPTAKDFVVQWEDLAPTVIDWAGTKSSFVAQQYLAELKGVGPDKPSLGIICYSCMLFESLVCIVI